MIGGGSNPESSGFSEFGIQDYVENPVLIQVLRVNESKAQIAIAKLTRAEKMARRELAEAKQQISDELVKHEQTRGSSKEETARLEAAVATLKDQLLESRRLSAVAVIMTWVGTALVAVGVNILTGTDNKVLGFGIVISGAAVEVVAFFVRRPSK